MYLQYLQAHSAQLFTKTEAGACFVIVSIKDSSFKEVIDMTFELLNQPGR